MVSADPGVGSGDLRERKEQHSEAGAGVQGGLFPGEPWVHWGPAGR